MNDIEKGTGWIPQPDDENDKIYVPAPNSQCDTSVDLKTKYHFLQKEPYDQGQLGSCTANVVAAALRFGKNAEDSTGTDVDNSNTYANADVEFNPSRMYIYFNERLLSATNHETVSPEELTAFLTTDKPTILTTSGLEINRSTIEAKLKADHGAQIRDGIKSLQKYGVCSESTWPYMSPTDQHGYEEYIASPRFYSPPAGSLVEGQQHVDPLLTYWRIRDNGDTGDPTPSLISHMQDALAEGYPVAFGILLPDEQPLRSSGTLERQGLTERFVYGGWAGDGDSFRRHALLAVGYDSALGLFTVLNSWGLGFGKQGYFYLPYRWFAMDTSTFKGVDGKTYFRTDDFWVIKSRRRIDV